jgi:hypothetical protein
MTRPPPISDYITDFLAFDPLVVTFAAAGPASIHDDVIDATPAPDAVACPRFEFTVAGTWDLERKIDLQPPVDPTWPVRVRAAIAHGDVITGMTPAMVAAVWGYPAVLGTWEELDALPRWNYDGGLKYDHGVTFRAGRVVSVFNAPLGP